MGGKERRAFPHLTLPQGRKPPPGVRDTLDPSFGGETRRSIGQAKFGGKLGCRVPWALTAEPSTVVLAGDPQKGPLIQAWSSPILLLKGQISPRMSKTWVPQSGLYMLAEMEGSTTRVVTCEGSSTSKPQSYHSLTIQAWPFISHLKASVSSFCNQG